MSTKRSSSFLGGAFASIVVLAMLAIFHPNTNVTPAPASAATSGNTATQIATASGSNLVANPSFELAGNGKPLSWLSGNWGSNKTSFTYNTGFGHTGNRSATITMTKYANGDAKWYPLAFAAQSNTRYRYSDWYTSTVTTSIDAVEVDANNVVSYVWLGDVPASSTWRQAQFTFQTPAHLKTITFYHLIKSNGVLTIDDSDLELAANAPITTPGLPTPAPASSPATAPAPSVATAPAAPSTPAGAPTPVPVPPAPTAPSVSFTSPAASATVSGTQSIVVAAKDAQGIKNVQISLDGKALASLTSAPYTFSWDSTATNDGSHTLSVVATDTANLTAIASEVVTVKNASTLPTTGPTLGANTIPNPSAETATAGAPDSWNQDGWGTNTAVYSYLGTGHTGGHSLNVQVSNFSTGDADWSYTPAAVTPGGTYLFSDWYESDVTTEIDAAVTLSNGTVEYDYVQKVGPSATWAQAKTEYDAPANAVSISFFHLIAANGYLTTDDYSLASYTPAPLTRGLVSITYDDGWASQYTNVLPMLQANNQVATFYIISGELTDQPDYMSVAQIKALQQAGNEIGSHSITHPDFTTLTTAQIQNEMQQSQAALQSTFGTAVTDFAYPYGAYNGTTLQIGAQYYQTQRGVESGFNTKDSLMLNDIKVQNVENTTTPAQVAAWVDEAIREKTWLVLVYHEVATTPAAANDAQYTTQPSDMQAELNYIHSSGIGVDTVAQAIQEIQAQ